MMLKFRFPLVLICLLAVSSTVKAKSVIKWVIAMEPPITYKSEGKYVGYGMEMLRMIQKDMGEYDHKIMIEGNYNRLTAEVENGSLTCAIGLFKTEERLKTMYFSKVSVFNFFNMQIFLRKSTFEELGNPGTLSLRNMLKHKTFRLGISKGRTYTKQLREILKEFQRDSNVVGYSQINIAENLLKMSPVVGTRASLHTY